MSNIIFVGPGRVGLALTVALQQADQNVIGAIARDPHSASAITFHRETTLPVWSFEESCASEKIRQADIVFITTSDKAVTPVAQTLSDNGWIRAGQIVVHTSGSQGSDILSPVVSRGARCLCLHPLQTIADGRAAAEHLQGAYCTLEGDSEAVQIGQHLVHSWGGIPVEMDASQRPRYHAAAVLCSNAVTALAAVASELSGLQNGLPALLPLLQGAIDNLKQKGIPNALTGPIERGDEQTVKAHMTALQHNPTARQVYAALGQATADVALEKGSLSPDEHQWFRQLFKEALKA